MILMGRPWWTPGEVATICWKFQQHKISAKSPARLKWFASQYCLSLASLGWSSLFLRKETASQGGANPWKKRYPDRKKMVPSLVVAWATKRNAHISSMLQGIWSKVAKTWNWKLPTVSLPKSQRFQLTPPFPLTSDYQKEESNSMLPLHSRLRATPCLVNRSVYLTWDYKSWIKNGVLSRFKMEHVLEKEPSAAKNPNAILHHIIYQNHRWSTYLFESSKFLRLKLLLIFVPQVL